MLDASYPRNICVLMTPPLFELHNVTVYRGEERETYSCVPVCQRRITLGDGKDYFRAAIDQAGSLSSQASGAAAAAAARGGN